MKNDKFKPTKRKKKKIREMRPVPRQNADGTKSTHIMAWVGDEKKKRGKFGVFPTIAQKPGKEKSSNPRDWVEQTPDQAAKRGEMINVKRRKRAEKLAAGSWKKGIDKRVAMKEYRRSKVK